MRILGIQDGHSASAALVEDGEVVAAVQEERLTREKNTGGFPEHALRDVLDVAGVGLGDVDRIAQGALGEAPGVLLARQPLLLNGGHHLAVCGQIVVSELPHLL